MHEYFFGQESANRLSPGCIYVTAISETRHLYFNSIWCFWMTSSDQALTFDLHAFQLLLWHWAIVRIFLFIEVSLKTTQKCRQKQPDSVDVKLSMEMRKPELVSGLIARQTCNIKESRMDFLLIFMAKKRENLSWVTRNSPSNISRVCHLRHLKRAAIILSQIEIKSMYYMKFETNQEKFQHWFPYNF